MSRIQRMIIPDEKNVYHVMFKTALDALPFRDIEKDNMVEIIRRFSRAYFVEIMGFCMMDSHFHLVARMHLETSCSDAEIKARYIEFYENDDEFTIESGRIRRAGSKGEVETLPPPCLRGRRGQPLGQGLRGRDRPEDRGKRTGPGFLHEPRSPVSL